MEKNPKVQHKSVNIFLNKLLTTLSSARIIRTNLKEMHLINHKANQIA